MKYDIMKNCIRLIVCCLLLAAAVSVTAEEKQYSEAANVEYPTALLWGDTHLHTNLSIDANGMGNKSLTPDDAYRFAKGEPLKGYNGSTAQLSRPLDFLVIADHAENLGVMANLEAGHEALERSEIGKRWKELLEKHPLDTTKALNADTIDDFHKTMFSVMPGGDGRRDFFWVGYAVGPIGDEAFQKSVWGEVIANAEKHNDPGTFTALVGYEWTSTGGGTGFGGENPELFNGNLHRVVIFKDGPEKTRQVLPFSALDSKDPEDLWSYMEKYENLTGGEVFSIPHNGNVSAGEMFALTDFDGNPLGRDYAEMRSRWEPLYEVTQIKGDGEAHPLLSPTDEFADYETWNSWGGEMILFVKPEGRKQQATSEYARSALKLGLDQKASVGVNPFKFGMIGSTDAHTSMATADELNFWGKLSLYEPSRFRAVCCDDAGLRFTASGYAAVWAQDNTRASIFEAMKRKETYATTGPRISVRFYGGWNFVEDDTHRPNLEKTGYDKGVPMGGDLTKGPKNTAPSFLIRAVKDPEGANLDRVQVIKGWRSEDGELHEKVYNVALSDNRKDRGRKTKPVGNTVNLENASYLNSIGDPELSAVWRDPDFDPAELAFYYARVLEIPTPRWSTYDAKFFDIRHARKNLRKSQQERAYTSPIWYTPTQYENSR